MPTLSSPGQTKRKVKPAAHSGFKVALLTLAVVVVGGGMALLWGKVSSVSDAHARLAEENRRLREELSEAQSALNDPRRMPWQRASSSGPAGEKEAEPRPEVTEPPAPLNSLVLEEAEVAASDDGALVARMRFQPTSTDALDVFALVIRLPRTGESRILGLRPVGEAVYSNAVHRVAGDGFFAIYQAQPTGVGPLEFDLTVSEPGTATVRGTLGLEPFEMDIQPGTATVTKI